MGGGRYHSRQVMESESERKTRLKRVDPLLRVAGWSLLDFKPGLDVSKLKAHAVREYETANGPADYALVVDGQVLGIVEAKKVTLGPQNVPTRPSGTRKASRTARSTSAASACRSSTPPTAR